ncbi:Uncharacterised protein [Mycobacteroides abscessus subsp. bolletii]|nr:Uncharacterised protein [Mycobacteroides abscessus subsp. bolletii]SHY73073.1 Uncharacterised protein [Mycobacteroides abscessus subsp. bolletii]
MHTQMVVILEPAEQKPMSVGRANRIADMLLRSPKPRGGLVEAAPAGEITPSVAYQLTETAATFSVSGTSHRVHNVVIKLCPSGFGPGTRVVLDDRNVLVIKSCAKFPLPVPSESGSKDGSGNDAAFNQALDAATKLMSLAVQAWQSP